MLVQGCVVIPHDGLNVKAQMTLPYYPFYWGDYSAKTFNLTQGQHGAYMLLLRHIYTEGTQISVKHCYSIAKALLPEERENVDYVLEHYFVREGDFWVNYRSIEVMEEWSERHQRRVIAGKKPKKKSLSNAQAIPKQPEPEPDIIRLDSAREKVDLKPKPINQFDLLEKQLREAAGWESEPAPNLCVIGPVATVLTLGVDLELDLLPAARAHGPRLTSRTSWKYILQAAISNRDNRLSSAANASKPIQQTNGNSHVSKPEFIHPATVAANKLRAKLGIESDSGQARHDGDDWIEGDYSAQ